MTFVRRSSLGPTSRCVLVANDNGVAQFHHASKHVGSNIGTAGVIAEVFGEQFLVPVWSREARFDRHVWNGESLQLNDFDYPTWRTQCGSNYGN